jgi:hypothetical protein
MGVVVDRELTVGGAAHVELDHVGPHLAGALNAATVFSGNAGGAAWAITVVIGSPSGAPSHMTIACRVPEEALAGS